MAAAVHITEVLDALAVVVVLAEPILGAKQHNAFCLVEFGDHLVAHGSLGI